MAPFQGHAYRLATSEEAQRVPALNAEFRAEIGRPFPTVNRARAPSSWRWRRIRWWLPYVTMQAGTGWPIWTRYSFCPTTAAGATNLMATAIGLARQKDASRDGEVRATSPALVFT